MGGHASAGVFRLAVVAKDFALTRHRHRVLRAMTESPTDATQRKIVENMRRKIRRLFGNSSARKSVGSVFGRVLAAAAMAAALLVVAPCSSAGRDSVPAFTLNGNGDAIVVGDRQLFTDRAEKAVLPKSFDRALSEGVKPAPSKSAQPTPVALLGLGLVALSLLGHKRRTRRSGPHRAARALASFHLPPAIRAFQSGIQRATALWTPFPLLLHREARYGADGRHP